MAQAKTMATKSNGFKFKWWMAIIVIGVIVAIGVLVRLLSFAGGSGSGVTYNESRAYVLYSDRQYLGVIKLMKQTSTYAEEQWINLGYYPKAAGAYKANTVPRWVKSDTLVNSSINANSICATLSKVIIRKGTLRPIITNITATPALTKGDNVDLVITTSGCDSPTQG